MRFNTLAEWLNWQEGLHPREIDLGLERVAAVLSKLDLTPVDFTVITVAGTNGKGSCVAMLEAILLAAGYRVGAYTSPHLLRYNERIRINGNEVADQALCAAFEEIDNARADVSLSYFEFGTLAAIDIFQRAGVDIAILEVGLGGRLDAVNVLDADVALISAIDIDHQDWLGDGREAIGREKAGILRAGRPAVCIDSRPPQSLLDYAQQLAAPLFLSGRDFQAEAGEQGWHWQGPEGESLQLPRPALAGDYQLQNAAGVLMCLRLLADRFPLDNAAIRRGLGRVQLAGRFQQLAGRPAVILDVAHNAQSARALAQNLTRMDCQGRTHLVFAMLADKDIAAVVDSLRGPVDEWYLAPLPVPRGASLAHLQASTQGLACQSFASLQEAYAAACRDAQPEDRLVVAGSFYTVAAVLAMSPTPSLDQSSASST